MGCAGANWAGKPCASGLSVGAGTGAGVNTVRGGVCTESWIGIDGVGAAVLVREKLWEYVGLVVGDDEEDPMVDSWVYKESDGVLSLLPMMVAQSVIS